MSFSVAGKWQNGRPSLRWKLMCGFYCPTHTPHTWGGCFGHKMCLKELFHRKMIMNWRLFGCRRRASSTFHLLSVVYTTCYALLVGPTSILLLRNLWPLSTSFCPSCCPLLSLPYAKVLVGRRMGLRPSSQTYCKQLSKEIVFANEHPRVTGCSMCISSELLFPCHGCTRASVADMCY